MNKMFRAIKHVGIVTSQTVAKTFDDIASTYSLHKHSESTPGDLIELPDYINYLDECKSNGQIDFKNVLEVGCGTGWLTKKILNSKLGVENLIAVDVSKELIKIAQNDLSKNFPKAQIIEGSILDLSLKDESIDLVIAANAIDCIAETEQALKKIYSILKPGGKFIFFIRDPKRNAEYVTGNPDQEIKEGFYEESWPGSGERRVIRRYLSFRTWMELLDKSGFKLWGKKYWNPAVPNSVKFTNPDYYELYSRRPGALIISTIKV